MERNKGKRESGVKTKQVSKRKEMEDKTIRENIEKMESKRASEQKNEEEKGKQASKKNEEEKGKQASKKMKKKRESKRAKKAEKVTNSRVVPIRIRPGHEVSTINRKELGIIS
jgi:hypothetical protein